MSRLLITGTNSGCGKTTVTCAVLSALKTRGISPTAFKCGPDYIDPLFHRAVSDIQAYNLDPFFWTAAVYAHILLPAQAGSRSLRARWVIMTVLHQRMKRPLILWRGN